MRSTGHLNFTKEKFYGHLTTFSCIKKKEKFVDKTISFTILFKCLHNGKCLKYLIRYFGSFKVRTTTGDHPASSSLVSNLHNTYVCVCVCMCIQS